MKKNNVLIIWNEVTDKKHLEHFIQNSFFSADETLFDFAFNKLEFEAKQRNWCDYTHLIVLCELTWNDKLYSNLYGIDLMKNEIRLKGINLPVLFLSFLSREQLIELNNLNDIISTYALGNHFIQLPTPTKSEIEKFYKMELVPETEMEDTLNFISLDKIISTIRHDVTNNNIDECILRLSNIVEKSNKSNKEKEELLLKLNKKNYTVEKVISICDELEKKLPDNRSLENNNIKYKVLLLEDTATDGIKALIKEAKDTLDIVHFKKTSEAYEALIDDTFNEFLVIIVDFRIWDNPDVSLSEKLMSERQGYRFIEDVVKLGRRYTFVSFSELPRAFRLRIASSSQSLIIPEEKSLVLSTYEQRLAFINKLRYWAEQTQLSFAQKASKDPVFIALYNFYMSSKINNESFITTKSNEWINEFNKAFIVDEKIHIDNLFDKSNSFSNFLSKEFNKGFEFKQEKFKVTALSQKDLNAFTSKLIMRRLVIYAYWCIDEVAKDIYEISSPEHIKVIDADKKSKRTTHYNDKKRIKEAISDFKKYFGVVNIINTLLIQGFITKKFCYIRNEEIFDYESRNIPAKASSITNKTLWIHNKKNIEGVRNRRVEKLSDIGFTREEEKFFKSYYPALWEEWNNKL